MLQKSGRLVLWEAMFILELHSAETQGKYIDLPRFTSTEEQENVSCLHHREKTIKYI